MPLYKLVSHLPIHDLEEICKMHGVYYSFKERKSTILQAKLIDHVCRTCPEYSVLFLPVCILTATQRVQKHRSQHDKQAIEKAKTEQRKYDHKYRQTHLFPPDQQIQSIVNGFVQDSSIECLNEEGCAVCGCLVTTRDLQSLSEVSSKAKHTL
jgi:hypothetical protein